MDQSKQDQLDFCSMLNTAQNLPLIPEQAVKEYTRRHEQLIDQVNQIMSSREDILRLIGENDLRMMFDNHRNHAAFMGFVFKFGDYEALARSLPWVYRSYSGQGFNLEYFQHELRAWIKAISKHITYNLEIITIYEWLLNQHDLLSRISKQEAIDPHLEVAGKWESIQKGFLGHLLRGDARGSLEISRKAVNDLTQFQEFMLQVIKPSMYQIGFLWETGKISVAQEHLATSIASTVLSSLYSTQEMPEPWKGRILVAAAPNEYHELGAWILSIMFEINGWESFYLGANMPVSDLVQYALDKKPDILALSVAILFNLEHAQTVIKKIRDRDKAQNIKILLGGQACSQMLRTCQDMNPDYHPSSAEESLQIAEAIWNKKYNESESVNKTS